MPVATSVVPSATCTEPVVSAYDGSVSKPVAIWTNPLERTRGGSKRNSIIKTQ